MSACKHQNFNLIGNVGRIVRPEDEADKDNAQPIAFTVDVKIQCRDCGLPFEWVGFPMGFSFNEPRVSVDCQELRAPLKPKGEAMPALQGAVGFSARRTM